MLANVLGVKIRQILRFNMVDERIFGLALGTVLRCIKLRRSQSAATVRRRCCRVREDHPLRWHVKAQQRDSDRN